jgi:hypothetical protein
MGEYAIRKSDGQEIKIGTCEDMYYLRADQREMVAKLPGSVDVSNPDYGIRFRFPFPQEDGIEPGAFTDHAYGVTVPGMITPKDVEHSTVQVSAHNGQLFTSVPCPFGGEALPGLRWHGGMSDGWPKLVQQRQIHGQLWAVLECPGCGAKWRQDEEGGRKTAQHFLNAAEQMSKEADARQQPLDARASHYTAIARRIVDGYKLAPVAA